MKVCSTGRCPCIKNGKMCSLKCKCNKTEKCENKNTNSTMYGTNKSIGNQLKKTKENQTKGKRTIFSKSKFTYSSSGTFMRLQGETMPSGKCDLFNLLVIY
ncbi:unnamed protein product, partial [Owenia fusiformis]